MLIGIVGKPSSGKSTFLNASCLTNAKTGNYPFTTIEPNIGKSFYRVECVCTELKVKDNPKNSVCVSGNRYLPIKLLDVAGLVPGAHLGKGMGNKFLSDLSRADALIHVVDISGKLTLDGQELSEEIHDPLEDIQFLEQEINYWFRNILKKNDWTKFARKIQQEKLSFVDMLYIQLAGINVKKEDILLTMKSVALDFTNLVSWSDEDLLIFASKLREISKPIIIAANKMDKQSSFDLLKQTNDKYSGKIFSCSGLTEFMLRDYDEKGIIKYNSGDSNFEIVDDGALSSKEKIIFKTIKEKIFDVYGGTGVQEIINYIVQEILDLIVVYPVHDVKNLSDKDGNVLPDAHLVKKGTKLIDYVEHHIHSDLAKNFIYAVNVKNKMRLGKDYELNDGDVVKIYSAV